MIPVLLIFVLDRLGLFSKKKQNVVQDAKSTIVKTIDKVKTEVKSEKDVRSDSALHYDSWGRDPFSTPELEKRKAGASSLNLKGMFWMDGKPYVLINDVVLSEGEEKKGIKVNRIDGKKVYCTRGGQSITLQWSEKR